METKISKYWVAKKSGELWVIDGKLPNGKYQIRKDPDAGWLCNMREVSEKQLRKHYMEAGNRTFLEGDNENRKSN